MSLCEERLRVLFVDDDPNIRTVARIGLEGLTNWQVELADSGYAGIETAQKDTPDVILLDIMMPGLDGKQTFAKLQESAPLCRVPVIFITAKVQTAEVQQYMKLGAAGVITKPFDPMSLPDEISSILALKAKRED